MRFSASSQITLPEKSIFGQFEVFFLNVLFYPRAGVVNFCYYNQDGVFQWKDEIFNWSQQKVI